MAPPKKKNKTPKSILLLTGFSLGFLAWLGGFHCFEADKAGRWRLSAKNCLEHLAKILCWTIGLTAFVKFCFAVRGWLLQAPPLEIGLAALGALVVFLYIKVLLPGLLVLLTPGLHRFFCPQCFQKQTFRFFPLSFQFGFFVTYLCRYCSCLVDGRGEQVFYPRNLSFFKNLSLFIGSLAWVLLTLFLGLFSSLKFFGFF